MIKPVAIDEEYVVSASDHIVSKTDKSGKILYANDIFAKISGYKRRELEGQQHNIIRHPDMPKIIFKMMWDRILNKKNIVLFVKNLRKDGKYYWIITDFDVITDNQGNITNFYAYRKAAPRKGIREVRELYKKLLEIEKKRNMEASKEYFEKFLREKQLTYDEYVNHLVQGDNLFDTLITSIKKIF